MMDLIRLNQERRNYESISVGLAFVGEKLQGYTEYKLDETYKDIYKTLAGKPPCHQQCSKVYNNRIAQWCDTCSSWKRELCKTRLRHRNIDWSRMDSSNWSASYEHIAQVYLPSSWNDLDFLDVSTACHIWTNLKTCNINDLTIARIKQIRNVNAHNARRSSTDRDKVNAFDAFRDLLNDADLNGYIDSRECIDELFRLKDAKDREIANIEAQLVEIRKWQMAWILYGLYNKIMIFLQWIVKRITFDWKTFKKYYILIFLLLTLLLAPSLFPSNKIQPKECLSEDYKYPFKQDMPLLGYFSEHSSLIGREWLFEEIIESMLKKSSNDRKSIIALVAEMGYGKSALVAHMLCPNSNSRAKIIRKHIVGFHICKFDVSRTHEPARFIRRLVGFFALRCAEYGHKIAMLQKSSILYNLDECSRDFVACFDQGVTIPLKQIQEVENAPWIIVIDALDECETFGQNNILELLLNRAIHLPKFVKFLVTSRNTSLLTHFKRLERLEINHYLANDTRNIKDITDYIIQHLGYSDLVDKLVDYSDGNFVYVVQAIKSTIANKNINQIPQLPVGLEDVYAINFDRIYKDDMSYAIPKMILEIVSSAANPIGKYYIFQVLSKNNVTQNTTEYDKHFRSLSFFLNGDDIVRLTHQALFHWLVNERNLKYRISLERGHALTSHYLLGLVPILDLVELAIHVSNSEDQTLNDLFKRSNFSSSNIDGNFLLHKLIWKTEDERPLKLLLEHAKSIDGFNNGNITPIFVAASKGHIFQLKLLHKMGANLNFQVSSDILIYDIDVESKIYWLKHVLHSGYSLLHIASQNGHTDIAQYLIQQNKSLLYVKNALGLHPGLVACENGFLDIIKEMYYTNRTLFRNECLYYASKHNHLQIVKWLASQRVQFMCISDDSSRTALNEITSVNEGSFKVALSMFPYDRTMRFLINPLDIWWQVFKFDPLMVAIRNGSIQAAQYLIETFPEALGCSDVFGFTPALAVVAFNQWKLLPVVANIITTDKCQAVPLYMRQTSLTFVQDLLSRYECPDGAGLAHMLALYDNPNIFSYVIQHDLVKDWNEADEDGYLPVHYASRVPNIKIMKHYKDIGNLYENAKSSQDVTIYHITATNDVLASLTLYNNNLLEPIPDLRDMNNKNVLHYLVLRKCEIEIVEADNDKSYYVHDIYTELFVHLINAHRHDFMLRDVVGRNILHFALFNGHFKIVQYLAQLKNSPIRKMLFQQDLYGDHPVAYSLQWYNSHNIKLPGCLVCINFEIVEMESVMDFMSAWELSLLQIIKRMKKYEFKTLLEPYLSHIWSKSVYLFVAVIHNHKQYVDLHLMRNLLLHHHDSILAGYNQLVLAHFLPSVFRYCMSKNMPIDSPLLYVVRNFDFDQTFFSLYYKYGEFMYKTLIKSKHRPKICTDTYGYNIVYHAIKTGNIQTALILIRNGISVTSPAIGVKGIFHAALTSRRRNDNTNFYGCITPFTRGSQLACVDKLLVEVLNRNSEKLKAADFCRNSSVNLSLIHILSANGMFLTLKRLVGMFSSQILECYNKDGFTPLYLAQMFNEASVTSFISSKSAMFLPNRYAEKYLIISLLQAFPLNNCSSCLQIDEFDRRQFGRWYYCVFTIIRQLSLSKEYYLQKASGILQHVGKNVQSLVTCADYFVYHSRFSILPECGSFVQRCFICYGNVMRLQNSIRDFFVLKAIGQFPKVANYAKLELLIKLSMKRLLIAADQTFCSYYNKGVFDILKMTITKTVYNGRIAIRDLALGYFLRFNESNAGYAPHAYSFLQSRRAVYGLQSINTEADFALNVHKLYYLDVLSKTLSFNSIKDALQKDVTAVAIYKPLSKSFKVTQVRLTDPFADLH